MLASIRLGYLVEGMARNQARQAQWSDRALPVRGSRSGTDNCLSEGEVNGALRPRLLNVRSGRS
jgi:hypothetical protein